MICVNKLSYITFKGIMEKRSYKTKCKIIIIIIIIIRSLKNTYAKFKFSKKKCYNSELTFNRNFCVRFTLWDFRT